ncbi:MAG: TIGR04282 family arsenosugar biosynthesis glycosyltransferase [Nitrospinae bacterium]|nr:TIGR04282 family arsenosugar biosynthesis glycosyltransferase [Nitrospinota bacterium]
MDRHHDRAIVLFARDPAMGMVKTRLEKDLDRTTVFNLYTRFLDDSLEILREIPGADRFCGVYPSPHSGYFDRPASLHGISVFRQEGDDLGERMLNAFAMLFAEGYEKAVVIGSDSPSLPVRYIEMAFDSDKDLTIGPSVDFGYYLIGMREKAADVFTGVPWGSANVLSATLERIKQTGATLEVLPPWYDIDRIEDLRFLKIHLDFLERGGMDVAPHAREFLKQLDL